jgi:hypothetical protein
MYKDDFDLAARYASKRRQVQVGPYSLEPREVSSKDISFRVIGDARGSDHMFLYIPDSDLYLVARDKRLVRRLGRNWFIWNLEPVTEGPTD